MKPKIVLVPLDGSRLTEKALAPAAGFAREGATIVLLRAAGAHGTPFADAVEAAYLDLNPRADWRRIGGTLRSGRR